MSLSLIHISNVTIMYGTRIGKNVIVAAGSVAVSYTHLDVYKRQIYFSAKVE